MATTITRQGVFTPSAVDLDISEYLDESSPFSNAYGKGSDNEGDYAEWGLVTGSQAYTKVYWGFDLSSIPSNATITNVKCEARCSNTNQSIAQGGNTLIAIGTTNGTAYVNKVDSGNQAFGTTAKVVTVSSADFTREELDNFRLKIQAVRGFFSTSTSYHTKFYGATLTIDYEVPVEVNKYTVRFLDYNGDVLDTQTVEEGGNATPPNNPTREGYNFTGWSGSYTNVTQDTDIIAQYKIKTFTVRFLDWNNSELAVQTVDYGSDAAAPPYPTRDGYLCIGWDNYEYTNISSNLDIIAQYVQEQGTPSNNSFLSFKDRVENASYYNTSLIQANDYSISITANTDSLCYIEYPYPEEWKGKNVTFTIGDMSDYGQFSISTLTLDNSNKSGTINVPIGSNATIGIYTLNGEVGRICWVTDVYATLPEETITHTVRFLDWNDNVLDTQTINDGGNATPPNDPVRDGYRFTGWNGSYTNITADTDIIAQYIKLYNIVASAKTGGTISPSGTTTVDEGGSQSYTISANTGHRIKDVLVDGTSQGAITSYTFNDVNANHTIEVEFEGAPTVVAAIENNTFYALNIYEGYDKFLLGEDGIYLNRFVEDLGENDPIYIDENGALHVYQMIEGPIE